jgi:hypothetical protein
MQATQSSAFRAHLSLVELAPLAVLVDADGGVATALQAKGQQRGRNKAHKARLLV